jgi:hypothetical protein
MKIIFLSFIVVSLTYPLLFKLAVSLFHCFFFFLLLTRHSLHLSSIFTLYFLILPSFPPSPFPLLLSLLSSFLTLHLFLNVHSPFLLLLIHHSLLLSSTLISIPFHSSLILITTPSLPSSPFLLSHIVIWPKRTESERTTLCHN